MKAEGYIEQVAIVYAGSNLSADHAIDDTVLSVEDAVDFDEEGGILLLNDVEYVYETADVYNNTVTLASGLLAPANDFDEVRILPAQIEKLATVSQGEGDSLTAIVSHHLYGFIEDGVRQPGQKENVMVEEVNGVWYVVDILGMVPVFNGEYIDPDTLPSAGTDGLTPEYSPGPTVRGGYGSLYITYPPVPNNDPVTYDIHVSTEQGFVPSGATLVASTPGTIASVNSLADSPLVADTTYYVQIVARDADGAADPGQEASGQIVTGVDQTDLDNLNDELDALRTDVDAKPDDADVEAAKQAAIDAAATDAQAKADAAATAAETAAKAHADLVAGNAEQAAIDAAALDAQEKANAAQAAAEEAAALAAAAEYGEAKARVEEWKVTGKTTIDGGKIETDSISSAQIAAGAIQTDHMDANSIHGDRILANSLGADKIVANSITADQLAANAITSDLLIANDALINALQATTITGVTITGALIQSDDTPNTGLKIDNAGLTLYNPSGSPTTTLKSDGNSTFRGEVIANGLTVLDGMSLRGTDNEISQGAQLRLATATTESTNAPNVIVDWHGTRMTYDNGMSYIPAVNSLFRQTDGKYITVIGGESNGFVRFSSSGMYEGATTFNGSLPLKNVVQLNGEYYGTCRRGNENQIVHLSGGADNQQYVSELLPSFASHAPALGVQGSNLVTVTYEQGTYVFRIVNPSTLKVTSTKSSNYVGLNQPEPMGIVYGNFDLGSAHYAVAVKGGGDNGVRVFNVSTGAENTNEGFAAPASTIVGITWNGSKFITLASNTLYEHTGNRWTTQSSAWKAGFSWYNSTTGEYSAVSPYANFTMKKRARVTVSAPELPSTANSIRVYMGYQSGNAYLQASSSPGYNSLTITGVGSLTSGTAAPLVGTFSPTLAASIRSTNDELVISADGTAKVKGLIAYSDEDADTSSGNDPALITGDPAGSHLRFDGDEIISMANPSTQSTLYLNDGGITYTSRMIITSTTDANAASGNTPPLRIGNITGNHLRIDGNEIISMNDDSNIGWLHLNQGGQTRIGAGAGIKGVQFGTFRAGGDSLGNHTVTHNLGMTPSIVLATADIERGNGGEAVHCTVGSLNSSTFSLRVNTGGSAGAENFTGAVTVHWIAIA